MAREIGVHCLRNGCIALAAKDSVYCTVHRWFETVDRTLGLVAPIEPVTTRIEYEKS